MEYIENLIIKHFDPRARTMRLFCETFKNSRLTLPTEELICQFFQPTNELLKQFMEELNNKSEKKSRQVFQGLIVKKKTDVDFFQTISEVFEQPWCFRNLGNLPKRGDIIFVVTDNIKDGIISVCEVTSERPLPVKGLIGIELSDLEDRQARNEKNGNLYVKVKLIRKIGYGILPENWKRGQLPGSRQSTFKKIPESFLNSKMIDIINSI